MRKEAWVSMSKAEECDVELFSWSLNLSCTPSHEGTDKVRAYVRSQRGHLSSACELESYTAGFTPKNML